MGVSRLDRDWLEKDWKTNICVIKTWGFKLITKIGRLDFYNVWNSKVKCICVKKPKLYTQTCFHSIPNVFIVRAINPWRNTNLKDGPCFIRNNFVLPTNFINSHFLWKDASTSSDLPINLFSINKSTSNTFLFLSTISFCSISYNTAVINPLLLPPYHQTHTHTHRYPHFPLSFSAAVAAVAVASQLAAFICRTLRACFPMSSTSRYMLPVHSCCTAIILLIAYY